MSERSENKSIQQSKSFLRSLNLLTVAGLVLIGLAIVNGITAQAWQHYLIAAALFLMMLGFFASRSSAKNGKLDIAVGLVVSSLTFGMLVITALLANIGFLTAIALIVIATLLSAIFLDGRKFSQAIITILLAGFLIILLDLQELPFRLAFDSLTQNVSIGVLLVLAAGLSLVILRRFSSLDVSTKLILTMIVIAVIPMGLIGFYFTNSTSTYLNRETNQRLLNAASRTASELETLITETGKMVANHAATTNFLVFLQQHQENPAETAGWEITSLLAYLADRDPQNILSYEIYDRTGQRLASSSAAPAALSPTEQRQTAEFVRMAVLVGEPQFSQVLVNPNGSASFSVSARINSPDKLPLGALVAHFNFDMLSQVISSKAGFAGVGSYPLLIDDEGIVLVDGSNPRASFRLLVPLSPERITTLQREKRLPSSPANLLPLSQTDIRSQLMNLADQTTLTLELPVNSTVSSTPESTPHRAAVSTLNNRAWYVLFNQPEAIFLTPLQQQARTSGTIAVLAVLVVTIIVVAASQRLVSPITQLTEVARQITTGDLTVRAAVTTQDEYGTLAKTFNAMTAQLRQSLEVLEQKVNERTADLRQRSEYLQAAAEVSKVAVSTLNIEELNRRIVGVILERFHLYYVGLFLLDENQEWAELQAGTGEAGRQMLARKHKIRVGQGMIGWSIANSQPRIALHAEEDAVRLATSELPLTRSEAALPLRSRGKVLGAITVQSARVNAFDQDAITTLQTMADQVAVAIENALLFSQAQEALEATRRAYGEISLKGWQELLQSQGELAYTYQDGKIAPALGSWSQDMISAVRDGQINMHNQEQPSATIPIKVSGISMGAVTFRKHPGELPWSKDELLTLEQLIERLGSSLENARLYQDTRRQAAREQLMVQLSSQMRQTLDVETVLRTAVNELYQSLDMGEVTIRLIDGSTPSTPPENGNNRSVMEIAR